VKRELQLSGVNFFFADAQSDCSALPCCN
jgi:hypothetical protein